MTFQQSPISHVNFSPRSTPSLVDYRNIYRYASLDGTQRETVRAPLQVLGELRHPRQARGQQASGGSSADGCHHVLNHRVDNRVAYIERRATVVVHGHRAHVDQLSGCEEIAAIAVIHPPRLADHEAAVQHTDRQFCGKREGTVSGVAPRFGDLR